MNGMRVTPAGRLEGRIVMPGDKSISHRAAIIAAMAEGGTAIANFSTAADCGATLRCLQQLGVLIRHDTGCITIEGVGKHGFRKPDRPLDCGNSGTTARLLAGLLAGQPFESVLTGDDSLRSRPMGRIVEPLRQMGAIIDTNGYRLPIKITGKRPLNAIEHTPAVASAQVKSCVMIAGLLADGETVVKESVQTRDHTERMFEWFGVDVKHDGGAVSVSDTGRSTWRDVSVPGDISAAAFFIVAAACLPGSEITISDLGLNPQRTRFLDVLRNAGIDIAVSNETMRANEPVGTVIVRGHGTAVDGRDMLRLSGPDIPVIIDELPILAVFGARTGGIEVRDAGELRQKETDRIAAVVENLRRMGADVEEFADGFTVGSSDVKGSVVESFGDHRIAMAFAVGGLLADGDTEIIGPECVDVSFPGFFEVLAGVSL